MAKRKKRNPLIKPFKPSKKFQKQYPKWQQTIKKREETLKTNETRKKYLEYYQQQAEKKFLARYKPKTWQQELEALARKIDRGQITVTRRALPEGDLFDKIAVLSNMADGFDEAAEILDVEPDLILSAITSSRMHRLQLDELQEQFSHFRRDTDEQDLFGINIEYLDQQASVLHEAERLVNAEGGNEDLAQILREAVGYNAIDLDKLNNCIGVLGDLTSSQLGRVLESWADSNFVGDIDLNQMFDLYLLDGRDILSGKLEDSLFWAWFRELFYA